MTTQYAAIDLVATGPDPARAEIVRVAVVGFDVEGEGERLESLIRPRRAVSAVALERAGAARADLEAAPDWPEFAPRLRRAIAGRTLVAFDPASTESFLLAAGVVPEGPVQGIVGLAELLVHDLAAVSMAALGNRLGIQGDGGGSAAMRRATRTAAIFRALLERLRAFDGSTLETLSYLAAVGEMPERDLIAAAAASRPSGPLFGADGGTHQMAFMTPRERPEPLRATGALRPIPEQAVTGGLATDGPLSQVVAGYERRPQQEAMALAVADALNQDGHLLVEAGTGTGKSLAYLLPAALHAMTRGETVVVSTNTLALQDQLYRKDLPDLREALGASGLDGLTASVLKGRANYLCLRSWFGWQHVPPADPAEARLRAKILPWLAATETGDRAELRLTSEEEAGWRHVAEEEGSCVPQRCVFQQRGQCFLYRARRRAEASHLAIVNHALLLSDVAAGSRILPEYERLVIDEAHHLEDQATHQFGTSVAERDLVEFSDSVLRRDGAIAGGTLATVSAFLQRTAQDDAARKRADEAASRIPAIMGEADAVRLAAGRLFRAVTDTIVSRAAHPSETSLRITPAVRSDAHWDAVELLLAPLEKAMQEIDRQLRWFSDELERGIQRSQPDSEVELQREDLLAELDIARRAGAELRMLLNSAISAPDGEMVYWAERWQTGDRSSLRAAPLRVGEMLREQLFGPLRTAVLTSATLTVNHSFDYMRERLGMEEAETLSVPSPFDYERSTLLYLVDDIPEPNAPGYQRALEHILVELAASAGGRMLVLFTSHAALQATARAIRDPLRDIGITLLAQRTDGTPRQLIERLREEPDTVVLGTATFWEGVDIVGSALSTLVITKLPFSVPSDPVFAARSELYDDPFGAYAVPQAVLKFKQGFGRLIRSSHDRGVCAVLDRRVLSKRYGASFIESLPACSVRVGSGLELPAEAAAWLDAGVDG